jgi:hypothetical protein
MSAPTRSTPAMLVVLLALSGSPAPDAIAQPFLVVPEAGSETPALLPGAELLDRREVAWSLGGSSGPVGTGIRGAHVALAHRGTRSGVQVTFTRFGTDFYDESRVGIALGGTGPGAMAILLDARRARIGEESRSGVGIGLSGRIRLADVELGMAAGPGVRAGEPQLFPDGLRVMAALGEGTRRCRLVVTTRGESAPDVEILATWSTSPWRVATGLDLRRGALRIAVGITSIVGILVERRSDPLSGDWTRAAVTDPAEGRGP